MFRAFYKPADGEYQEVYQDAETLDELPSGAILVIEINEDGTREIIEEKSTPTQKESVMLDDYKKHLEPKHDGGDTPEIRALRREHR